MEENDQFLTYKEVQAYLRISESTMLRIIKDPSNPLKVTYLGDKTPRIKLQDIKEWIQKQDEIYNKQVCKHLKTHGEIREDAPDGDANSIISYEAKVCDNCGEEII